MASRPGSPSSRRPSDRRGPRGRGQDRSEFGDERNIEDTVVKLYRCATVVKGGRRFSFGALVVVGDRQGQVGFGYGKANEVPPAVEKGVKQAKRAMFRVPLRGTSIPHRVIGHFGASRIVMIPASEGTGVIAGAAPRAVLELAGVKDVLTKCYGSTSPKNLVKATINGLKALRTRAMVEQLRGVALDLPLEPEPVKVAVSVAVAAVEAVASAPVAIEVPVEQPHREAVSPPSEETPHDA
jgi:small subunit ribosomal protein S5